MPSRFDAREHLLLARDTFRWLLIAAPLSLGVGAACAFFLWSLDRVTQFRLAHPNLLFLLPFAGVFVAFLYEKWGAGSEGGNNLLMDAIHGADPENPENDSQIVVPRRMAPLILAATLITHAFGGSAGREGTAVQMGGALAAGWGRFCRLNASDTRILLLCGLAAGFSGVFGTPLAATVFALEVLLVGRVKYDALIPCLLAALISTWTVAALGVHHGRYFIAPLPPSSAPFDWILAFKIGIAAAAFGLISVFFAQLTHFIGAQSKKRVASPLLRPFWGGIGVVVLSFWPGNSSYLGIGEASSLPGAVTISSAFENGGANAFSWAWKLIFTSLTLGSGFKGGEVTPLFFIGATLGNTLASLLHAPVGLMAALGFVAVFAGATNTPLACTLMGIELFGSQNAIYFALACFLSYAWSGKSSIYAAQRR